METYAQNDVSRVIWKWQSRAPAGSGADAAGMGRQAKAAVQFAVMLVIGLVLRFKFQHAVMSTVVFTLAGVVLLSGLFVPRLFGAIERFGLALGRYAAVGLTWALLVPFFYIVFVPAHFIARCSGKDPLCRKFPSDEPTYWVPRPAVESVEHYRKQH